VELPPGQEPSWTDWLGARQNHCNATASLPSEKVHVNLPEHSNCLKTDQWEANSDHLEIVSIRVPSPRTFWKRSSRIHGSSIGLIYIPESPANSPDRVLGLPPPKVLNRGNGSSSVSGALSTACTTSTGSSLELDGAGARPAMAQPGEAPDTTGPLLAPLPLKACTGATNFSLAPGAGPAPTREPMTIIA
jgi:hypothetical protein